MNRLPQLYITKYNYVDLGSGQDYIRREYSRSIPGGRVGGAIITSTNRGGYHRGYCQLFIQLWYTILISNSFPQSLLTKHWDSSFKRFFLNPYLQTVHTKLATSYRLRRQRNWNSVIRGSKMQLSTFETRSIYLIPCAYDGSIFSPGTKQSER